MRGLPNVIGSTDKVPMIPDKNGKPWLTDSSFDNQFLRQLNKVFWNDASKIDYLSAHIAHGPTVRKIMGVWGLVYSEDWLSKPVVSEFLIANEI